MQERTREVQRLHDLLEDTGIKLSVFVSDITGSSARRMLAALVDDERDPKILAGFAQGRMRPKIAELERALVGNFTDHYARLCAKMLRHIDEITDTVDELSAELDSEITPFHQARQQLASIPGVSNRVAMAVAIRGGKDAIAGVIMHTDQEYTAKIFRLACQRMGAARTACPAGQRSGWPTACLDSTPGAVPRQPVSMTTPVLW